MDALRKAEEAKRQSAESSDTDLPRKGLAELALEPIAGSADPVAAAPHPAHAAQATSPLPSLAQHLDSVNADLAAASSAAPNSKRPAPSSTANPGTLELEERERHAARNVFAAKHAQRKRAVRWLMLGLAAVVLLGIGGYFWWQLQSVTSGSITRAAALPHSPAPGAIPAPPATAPTSVPAELPAAVSDLLRPPATSEAPAKTSTPQRAPLPPGNDGAIRLSSSRQTPDPTLERAYEALQADRLADARRDYELVLRNDARNVDALLGLASIATRRGQTGNAADLYQLALEADPRNATALAGLTNLRGQIDPGLSESRLKTLLASQPESAALNFALGNLYARQNRWNDAQQAWFRAHTADPGNADYLYNLAVSLDHLRQKRLAVQYYQSALDAAGTHDAVFDKNQVRSRIQDLQQ